jgi:Zn-dependent peptidase ImmA (M78 family)/predicted secreted protein
LTNFRLLQMQAMKLAVALHRELETDLSHQVDVYAAIERLGIAIAFLPFTNLSGAYLPPAERTGGLTGITINSRHPRSRQRFSAAHELAHYLRDGIPMEDVQTEFFPRAQGAAGEREFVAEAFASWFLMPRQLVMRYVKQLEIGKNPAPEQVYSLSLAFGTSYSATANHLVGLGILDVRQFRRLSEIAPKWIKSQLAIHGPTDSWGDVWRIDRRGDAEQVTPRPGDEIVVALEEIPSTGYIWQLARPPRGMSLLDSTFELPAGTDANSEEVFGAAGTRFVVLRAEEPGRESLELIKKHPWEPHGEVVDRFRLDILIQTRQEGFVTAPTG